MCNSKKWPRAAAILQETEAFLYLGNMDAPSDLGHAKDYLNVQLSTQQQEKNSDYVVGGGGT